MTPERWRQVEDIFQTAVEIDGAERDAFLTEACGADAELRREVESLLAYEIAETLTDITPRTAPTRTCPPPSAWPIGAKRSPGAKRI